MILSDSTRRQLVDAKRFILDAPDRVPALWGRDHEVLHAEGESLLVVGPPGVGKTTVLQQLALRRANVLHGRLIGYPVAIDTQRLSLYLALDRPQQIRRSFKRMVSEQHKLGNLIVWSGPLPFNITRTPQLLAEFVHELGDIAGTPVGSVFADSLKDMASPLSSEDVGSAVNIAIAGVLASQVEFAAAHHQRKASNENKKPTSLADVYGSAWITAGAGSVVLLWGEPGDMTVELTHLKQPAEDCGPLRVSHDHIRGITTCCDQIDPWAILHGVGDTGITVAAYAKAIYGESPDRRAVERARRRLDRYVSDGTATRNEPEQNGEPVVYRPTAAKGSRDHRDPPRDTHTAASRESRNGSSTSHAVVTPITPDTPSRPPLREWGERDVSVSFAGDEKTTAETSLPQSRLFEPEPHVVIETDHLGYPWEMIERPTPNGKH